MLAPTTPPYYAPNNTAKNKRPACLLTEKLQPSKNNNTLTRLSQHRTHGLPRPAHPENTVIGIEGEHDRLKPVAPDRGPPGLHDVPGSSSPPLPAAVLGVNLKYAPIRVPEAPHRLSNERRAAAGQVQHRGQVTPQRHGRLPDTVAFWFDGDQVPAQRPAVGLRGRIQQYAVRSVLQEGLIQI